MLWNPIHRSYDHLTFILGKGAFKWQVESAYFKWRRVSEYQTVN